MKKVWKNIIWLFAFVVILSSCSKDPDVCNNKAMDAGREERMQPVDGVSPDGNGSTDGPQITDDDDDDDESESSKKTKVNN